MKRWWIVLLWLTLGPWGCEGSMVIHRPYRALNLLEQPARLFMNPSAPPTLRLVHGRLYRVLPFQEALKVEIPLWVQPASYLAFGIGAERIRRGRITLEVQAHRPYRGEEPHALLPETDIPTERLEAESVVFFRIDLSPLARSWVTLEIRITPEDLEAEHLWWVEPVLYQTAPNELPWAPLEKPSVSLEQFQALNSRFHTVLVVADRLAYGDLDMEMPGETPWPQVASLLAGAAILTQVYPVWDDPDRNLQAVWTGRVDGSEHVTLAEVFQRGLFQTYGFAVGDWQSLTVIRQGFHRWETSFDLTRAPDRWVKQVVDTLLTHQARGDKAFLAFIMRLHHPHQAARGLDQWLGALRRRLARHPEVLSRTNLCVLATGRVEAQAVRPGFLGCRMPPAVLVPHPVIRAPVAGIDVVPTLADWFHVSRKDAEWDGVSRLAWFFYAEIPQDVVVFGYTTQGGYAVGYEGLLWFENGRAVRFVPLNPRGRVMADEVYQAFMQRFLLSVWRGHIAGP